MMMPSEQVGWICQEWHHSTVGGNVSFTSAKKLLCSDTAFLFLSADTRQIYLLVFLMITDFWSITSIKTGQL